MNVTLKKPPFLLMLLFILYFLVAILSIIRSINIHAVDLFTLGVIPVLAGLILRTPWASIIFKLYLVIQTLGFAAFGITALIAYQLTPEDVKVVLNNHTIPMQYLIPTVCMTLIFQYWVALSRKTREYLTH
ncbi:hypothetical protein [Shewanella surugensis]|uniref:Uncharacterized protein n=1 Tax=Shewanella surugensis TaxID=212020 RepID=A0ABT0LCB3_9GAMM|nr:hypothetical protein [Shewanella surugensis]MCL1124821.1 hypothetical protein [Shewanella surugensis]